MCAAKDSTPTGDCFEAAAKFVTRQVVLDYPDDYRLVHGNVAKLRQDEPVNHAWVEERDLVHELSNGRHNVYSREAYYDRRGITNTRRYTPEEALTLICRHRNWGPWY